MKKDAHATIKFILLTVLISLIVAFITTNIHNRVDRTKHRIRFIKAYGEILTGYRLNTINSGEMYSADFDDPATLVHKFTQSIAIRSDCTQKDNFFDEYCLTEKDSYKTMDGQYTPMNEPLNELGQFVLNDGTLIMLHRHIQGLIIYADINGKSGKPNKLGIDLFAYFIPNEGGRVMAMGDKKSPYISLSQYCNPYKAHELNGMSCAYAVVVKKNYFEDIKMK